MEIHMDVLEFLLYLLLQGQAVDAETILGAGKAAHDKPARKAIGDALKDRAQIQQFLATRPPLLWAD